MDPARLSGFSVFAELDLSELEAIAAVASEAAVAAGHVLASEGDFAYAMYAIEEGTADVAIAGAVARTLGRATCSVRSRSSRPAAVRRRSRLRHRCA